MLRKDEKLYEKERERVSIYEVMTIKKQLSSTSHKENRYWGLFSGRYSLSFAIFLRNKFPKSRSLMSVSLHL